MSPTRVILELNISGITWENRYLTSSMRGKEFQQVKSFYNYKEEHILIEARRGHTKITRPHRSLGTIICQPTGFNVFGLHHKVWYKYQDTSLTNPAKTQTRLCPEGKRHDLSVQVVL